MTRDTPSRHQILQSSIKHLTRLLEAELATHPTRARKPSSASLAGGMTKLMAHDTALSSRIVAPYEAFFEGVSVGYKRSDDDSIWVVVDFSPASDVEIGAETPQRSAPRLRVHPVNSTNEPMAWITLEVVTSELNLVGPEALTVSLLANFDFKDKDQPLHRNVVQMVLRADLPGGGYEDLNIGFFPITTIPRLHTLIVESSRFDLQRMGAAAAYKLIMFLPVYGDYSFNLYDLSVETE